MHVVSSHGEEPQIGKCASGHHFVADACDLCDAEVVARYPYRHGDCIACGAFCGGQAYGCTAPAPLVIGTSGL